MTTIASFSPVPHFDISRMSQYPFNHVPTQADQLAQLEHQQMRRNQPTRALDFLDLSAGTIEPGAQISPSHAASFQDGNAGSEAGSLHGSGGEDGDEMMLDDDQRTGRMSHQDDQRRDGRKMKRFRLTHNQTRFLMSEFARQPHPDAAHRDYLSREIPGLSPRQVQVWFQNRRAKLKRLPSEDREKVLKSRSLPEDFDSSRTLDPMRQTQTDDIGEQRSSSTSATTHHTPLNQIQRSNSSRQSQPLIIKPASPAFPRPITAVAGAPDILNAETYHLSDDPVNDIGESEQPRRWESVIILGHTVGVPVWDTPEGSENGDEVGEEMPPPPLPRSASHARNGNEQGQDQNQNQTHAHPGS